MDNVKQRSFLGALASAIRAICSLVISLVSVGEEATEMLSATVKSAREKQIIDLSIDMDDYAGSAMQRASLRAVEEAAKIEAALAADASGQLRSNYNLKHAHLKQVIDSELSKLRASRAE